MSKESKLITSSVNLPINIVKTLVNVDDKRLEIPINEMIEDFNERKVEFVRTMTSVVNVDENVELTKSLGVQSAPTLVEVKNGEANLIENVSNIRRYIETVKV